MLLINVNLDVRSCDEPGSRDVTVSFAYRATALEADRLIEMHRQGRATGQLPEAFVSAVNYGWVNQATNVPAPQPTQRPMVHPKPMPARTVHCPVHGARIVPPIGLVGPSRTRTSLPVIVRLDYPPRRLYGADPECDHYVTHGLGGSGVRCIRCPGWFCA